MHHSHTVLPLVLSYKRNCSYKIYSSGFISLLLLSTPCDPTIHIKVLIIPATSLIDSIWCEQLPWFINMHLNIPQNMLIKADILISCCQRSIYSLINWKLWPNPRLTTNHLALLIYEPSEVLYPLRNHYNLARDLPARTVLF